VHSYEVSTHAISTLCMHPNKSLRAETKNIFKRDIFVKKNHHTKTQFELDLRNSMMYPYNKFEFNVCNQCRDNERKLKISNFFSKFKRDNSVKNQQTISKFEMDLCIPMTNLHMQFEPYTLYIDPNKSYRAETENVSRRITLSNHDQIRTRPA
jgi:hypothetical protein